MTLVIGAVAYCLACLRLLDIFREARAADDDAHMPLRGHRMPQNERKVRT